MSNFYFVFFAGACKVVENFIGKPLMWFPCMHHTLELILAAYIKVRWRISGATDSIYSQFQSSWSSIEENLDAVTTSVKANIVLIKPKNSAIKTLRKEVVKLLNSTTRGIDESFCRGDYQEFVRLVKVLYHLSSCQI